MQHASVYVTCPDLESARSIARALLDRRLIACANMGATSSMYRWEGAIEESNEVAMFLKTRREHVDEVIRTVESLHPYDVPCVVAFDLHAGAAPYLAWIDAETTS